MTSIRTDATQSMMRTIEAAEQPDSPGGQRVTSSEVSKTFALATKDGFISPDEAFAFNYGLNYAIEPDRDGMEVLNLFKGLSQAASSQPALEFFDGSEFAAEDGAEPVASECAQTAAPAEAAVALDCESDAPEAVQSLSSSISDALVEAQRSGEPLQIEVETTGE